MEKYDIDPTLCSLCVVEIVFLVYCFLGLPAPLASITLLSHSTSPRCWEVVGYIDLVLLLRSAIVLRGTGGKKDTIRLIAIIGAVAALCLLWSIAAENVRVVFVVGAAAAMFAFLITVILVHRDVAGAELCFVLIAVFVAVSGACVNPLQCGAYPLTEGPTAAAISQANEDDDLWITDHAVMGDLCVAQGAACISSVNTYPALSTWRSIGPTGTYEQIYNRYAHISVVPTHGEASFELRRSDAFVVAISLDDARKLGVTKWLTAADLSQYETDLVKAVEVSTVGSFKIWQLVDKD